MFVSTATLSLMTSKFGGGLKFHALMGWLKIQAVSSGVNCPMISTARNRETRTPISINHRWRRLDCFDTFVVLDIRIANHLSSRSDHGTTLLAVMDRFK